MYVVCKLSRLATGLQAIYASSFNWNFLRETNIAETVRKVSDDHFVMLCFDHFLLIIMYTKRANDYKQISSIS